jgi:hypothetical protein
LPSGAKTATEETTTMMEANDIKIPGPSQQIPANLGCERTEKMNGFYYLIVVFF